MIPPLAIFCAIVRLAAFRASWLAAALLAGTICGNMLGALQVDRARDRHRHGISIAKPIAAWPSASSPTPTTWRPCWSSSFRSLPRSSRPGGARNMQRYSALLATLAGAALVLSSGSHSTARSPGLRSQCRSIAGKRADRRPSPSTRSSCGGDDCRRTCTGRRDCRHRLDHPIGSTQFWQGSERLGPVARGDPEDDGAGDRATTCRSARVWARSCRFTGFTRVPIGSRPNMWSTRTTIMPSWRSRLGVAGVVLIAVLPRLVAGRGEALGERRRRARMPAPHRSRRP